MARKKFYRNRREVMGIPPRSLWYKASDKVNMILADQDEFLAADFDPTNFYRVKVTPAQRKNLFSV